MVGSGDFHDIFQHIAGIIHKKVTVLLLKLMQYFK